MTVRFSNTLLALGLVFLLSSPVTAQTEKKKVSKKLDLPTTVAPGCAIPKKGEPAGACVPGSDEARLVGEARSAKAPYVAPGPERIGGARDTRCRLTTDCPAGLFCSPAGYCAPAGSTGSTQGGIPNVQVTPFSQ